MSIEERAHDLAIATVTIMGIRKSGDIDVAALYDESYELALNHFQKMTPEK